jgi:hypothetical protein
MRASLLAAVTALVLAAATPAAIAQTAQEGYSAPGGTVQSNVQGGGSGPNSPASTVQQARTGSTTLPFSGLDLVFLLGAGMGLFALGIGLRRLTHSTDPSR